METVIRTLLLYFFHFPCIFAVSLGPFILAAIGCAWVLSAVRAPQKFGPSPYGLLSFSVMELAALIIRAIKLLSVFCYWGLFHPSDKSSCFVVLLYTFFCLAAYGPHFINGMQNPPEYDACPSFGEGYNLGFSDAIVSGTSLGYRAPTTGDSFGSVCPNTHSFCFPSTLSGFSYKEKNLKVTLDDSGSQYNGPFCVELTQDSRHTSNKTWSFDYGKFKLFSGGVVSCALNSKGGINDAPCLKAEIDQKDDLSFCGDSSLKQKTKHSWPKNSEVSDSSYFDGPFSTKLRISPPVLDWGQKYLYSPSVALLTVANTCNDSILHLYEPFSTDLQFYPCNFSEVSLGPGESALICFVYFPRWLGLSSGHLILQTSSGGFMVEAKGYAAESPFGIQPFLDLEISPGGRLSKNISLYNPFDETLYVEEITAWLSVSSGHNSVETEAICSMNKYQVFDNIQFPTIKDRLVVKSDQNGSPLVAIRPRRNWEISPSSSETLIEIDISVGCEGKIFGVFCLQLLRSSQDRSDTIMVPIEAEVDSSSAYDNVAMTVSATLEGLASCDGGETVTVISLRNDAPYLLSFVKLVEVADAEIFHIKYTEGLLLFPSTVTQVAVIYCSHLRVGLHDSPTEVSSLRENCKLLVLTNDSTSPQIEIPCEDILHICFGHQQLSTVGLEDESIYIESDNMRAGYVGRSMQLPQQVKVIETAYVDELVLGNWLSQGATGGMSVLENHEVLFPMIQVGSYISRWITVKNPSQHPVIMQLILNSGEIIDECRVATADGLVHPSSSSNLVLDGSTTPTKHGFSVPESALTVAYVHPYDHVSLGPIIFYPSNRCGWSGSALIRNNLTGVEWLSLRGFGGSLSLVLLERSELVHSVDFDVKMPRSLNFSLSDALLHMKEMTSACSQPLVKELYAKNTGDIPLEVMRIRVSGKECGLDGFMIHSCRGFALEPGQSTKLLISYQTDFSAAIVHRDLELALATGNFLMPMKASFPYDMLSICKKSLFWMRVKKYFVGFLFVASLIFLVFCFIFPQAIALGFMDYLCKTDYSSIHTTVKSDGETSLRNHDQRKSKSAMSAKMNHLVCSVGEDTNSQVQSSCGRHSYGQGEPSEQGISHHLMHILENNKQTSHLLDTPNEGKLPTIVQSSDTLEASRLGNLTVITGRERGRRRRKRSRLGAKFTFSEVSSSQSGNSTPSSPLSPVASATPKCNWSLSPDVEQPLESRTSISQVVDQQLDNGQGFVSSAKTNVVEPEVPLKCCSNIQSPPPQGRDSASRRVASKPLQTPPSTFSLHGEPSPSSLASTSTVAPHARAPGSKLHNQEAVQAREAGHADEYKYDIWDDHFSGLHLSVPKNVTSIKSCPAENNFDSFFVRGPQTLMTHSQGG